MLNLVVPHSFIRDCITRVGYYNIFGIRKLRTTRPHVLYSFPRSFHLIHKFFSFENFKFYKIILIFFLLIFLSNNNLIIEKIIFKYIN